MNIWHYLIILINLVFKILRVSFNDDDTFGHPVFVFLFFVNQVRTVKSSFYLKKLFEIVDKYLIKQVKLDKMY